MSDKTESGQGPKTIDLPPAPVNKDLRIERTKSEDR